MVNKKSNDHVFAMGDLPDIAKQSLESLKQAIQVSSAVSENVPRSAEVV